MTQTVSLALIGFGEVGKIFAREFLAGGGASVAIYDILLDDPVKGPPMRAAAADMGARVAASAADAARDARIVISAVTAASVLAVAKEAAGYLHQGQIFFDINSASPVTKKTAAGLVNAAHAKYVEGAVMAPVPGPGITVPILGGGPAAAEAASILNPLGMKIDPVTTEPGRASAMKLCRSIVIKGLEAIMVDCAAAAKAWGVEDEVFASLDASYPAIDFRQLAETMGGRVRQHGVRRAAEMREAASMVADLGLNPGLAAAIADAQERGADKK
jgi:3-hydroxyisobutyrate dehydrogenase-like beta-hydroxyacid dehydrogenase